MDYFFLILAIITLLLGFIGCILPVLPGPPLSFLAIILVQLTRFADFPTHTILFLGILALVIQLLDYIVPVWGTKTFGGSKAGTWGRYLQGAYLPHFQLPGGDLIVYKKVDGHIVTLAIPKDAKRTASIVGRKCRAEYAIVIETDDHLPHTSKPPNDIKGVVYEEGKEVRPDKYDDDIRVECSSGIHFFATRAEAEEYN